MQCTDYKCTLAISPVCDIVFNLLRKKMILVILHSIPFIKTYLRKHKTTSTSLMMNWVLVTMIRFSRKCHTVPENYFSWMLSNDHSLVASIALVLLQLCFFFNNFISFCDQNNGNVVLWFGSNTWYRLCNTPTKWMWTERNEISNVCQLDLICQIVRMTIKT